MKRFHSTLFSSFGSDTKGNSIIENSKVALKTCKECNKTFKYYKSFKDHQYRFHKFSGTCNDCGNIFVKRKLLVKHVKKAHNSSFESFVNTTYSEQQSNTSYCGESVLDIQTKLINKSQLNLAAKNKICIERKTTKAFKATENYQKKNEHIDSITHSEALKSINSNAVQGLQIETKVNNESGNQFQYSKNLNCVPFQVQRKLINQSKSNLVAKDEIFNNSRSISLKTCEKCNKKLWDDNINKHHICFSRKDDGTFSCNYCCKTYRVQRSMEYHISRIHVAMKKEDFSVCELCGKFVKSRHLRGHVKAVHEKRLYPCNQCNYTFCTKGYVAQHIKRVHQNFKPFTCDICKQKFGYKNYLVTHIKTVHQKLKPYSCYICKLKFGRKTFLDKHMRTVHQGIRHIECDICKQKLDSKYRLVKHLKAFHQKK